MGDSKIMRRGDDGEIRGGGRLKQLSMAVAHVHGSIHR